MIYWIFLLQILFFSFLLKFSVISAGSAVKVFVYSACQRIPCGLGALCGESVL